MVSDTANGTRTFCPAFLVHHPKDSSSSLLFTRQFMSAVSRVKVMSLKKWLNSPHIELSCGVSTHLGQTTPLKGLYNFCKYFCFKFLHDLTYTKVLNRLHVYIHEGLRRSSWVGIAGLRGLSTKGSSQWQEEARGNHPTLTSFCDNDQIPIDDHTCRSGRTPPWPYTRTSGLPLAHSDRHDQEHGTPGRRAGRQRQPWRPLGRAALSRSCPRKRVETNTLVPTCRVCSQHGPRARHGPSSDGPHSTPDGTPPPAPPGLSRGEPREDRFNHADGETARPSPGVTFRSAATSIKLHKFKPVGNEGHTGQRPNKTPHV